MAGETLIISLLKLKNGLDFPIVDSNDIKGGLYTVENISERDLIPDRRRLSGMLCFVKENSKYYKLQSDNTWALFTTDNSSESIGIPILDLEMIDSALNLPNKYITIPNKNDDLDGSTTSRELSKTGTYVDILFSAIRKLLSDVARMKNSFEFGIYSYNDENTAMSRVIDGYKDKPEEEPLWAIDEDDLSLMNEMENAESFIPSENILFEESVATINDTVEYTTFEESPDSKLIIYITSNNRKLIFELEDKNGNIINVDVSTIRRSDGKPIRLASHYNIMFVVGLTNNLIYISINDTKTNIVEGYWYLNVIYPKNPLVGENSYKVNKIILEPQILSKLKVYTKYLDFSLNVIPSAPAEDDYKFRVAHITVRSVKDKEVLLKINHQLPNNELIWVEASKDLYIKNNDNLFTIGSGKGDDITGDTGMTETELIDKLKEMGIVRETGGNLLINDISDLTFIHEETGKRFNFKVTGEGTLKSTEILPEAEELANRIEKAKLTNLSENVRTFIALLRIAENNLGNPNPIKIDKDAKLCSDRVKIGAFYAPLSTDTNHGCSHCFVELENTSDDDFYLKGCYLHFTKPDEDLNLAVYHLPLTGTLKAGSTYLIRGKKMTSNTIINVDSYDQEWYDNEKLLSFEIDKTIDLKANNLGYGFALTYGLPDLAYNTSLWRASNATDENAFGIKKTKFPYILNANFIDALCFENGSANSEGTIYWSKISQATKSNSIIKNVFELDPAKLAFQSSNTTDSSRARWAGKTDILVLQLDEETISFPNSDDSYPISRYTPKASYENKNVSTDKSKLDKDKPNMVTCSFGIDIYKTRCFNWISVGYTDEYVWIRPRGTDPWKRFESYKGSPATQSTNFPRRKEFSSEVLSVIYNRIQGTFPGDGTHYTSHKVILDVVLTNVSSPLVYEYVVGRSLKNGLPDSNHSSNIQTFTLYPTSYKPRIYQTSDQQGFHWIEYQVWAAAAKVMDKKIKADQDSENIIPILINTGDMTLNGTRINEWLDYYNAGRNLFDHLELANVVGNNDLCGTNVEVLGTGDDVGKSNSFYFHVFYCYEIDTTNVPIVNGKYIPSLYYLDTSDYRFIFINSEITEKNCLDWYKLKDGETAINIYTGFTVGTDTYHSEFTPIYTMVYDMLTTSKKCVTACHEMPFTVITNESLNSTVLKAKTNMRSLSNADALIGSHLNLLTPVDNVKGIYWFSRLMEFKGVKLCLGGHKHTYTCTYPLRENFKFGPNLEKNSKDNYNEYSMGRTLENDNVSFAGDTNLSKLPLTKRAPITNESGQEVSMEGNTFFPYTPVPNLTNGVTYFMCLATGYKLTSNKELPSANLKYSRLTPETKVDNGTDKAAKAQQYPMFAIISFNGDLYNLKLARINNIFNGDYKFNLFEYSTDTPTLLFLTENSSNNFGSWGATEANFITL